MLRSVIKKVTSNEDENFLNAMVITLRVEVMITSELESVRIRAVLHQNMMRQLRIKAEKGTVKIKKACTYMVQAV